VPELPEVEFARRQILRWTKGRVVVDVRPLGPGVSAPPARRRGWRGGRTRDVLRRGKTLLWRLRDRDEAALLHLGMTGSFLRVAADAEPPRHARVAWVLDDGSSVVLDDPRRFGHVLLGREARLRRHRLWDRPAPDPLTDPFEAETLAAALANVRSPLKVALMDQARILGLGNIHAAEACFRAGLDPRRPARSLKPAEIVRLHAAVRETLAYGIAAMGDLDGVVRYVEIGGENPFLVYDRAAEACPRCKRPIERFAQSGRSTYACLWCQH
jgi:formamidopyrimidine-DNA glycosylase